MNKKDIIEKLYVRRSDYKYPEQAENQANSLETVSGDIYSRGQRFIYELIQNADDAASGNENEIQFDFYPDCIVISHNGRPFDEKDIEAITSIGSGTKTSDQTKTGYKGIGFKSVFGKSDKVHVFSDGYNFRFDRKFIKQSYDGVKMPWQIIPIWTSENELPKSAKSIVSNGYNVSTVIELENTNRLQNELNELLSNGKILLFLRRIVKISVSINGGSKFSIEKNTIKKEKHFDEISILKNKTEISKWIVKTFENIPIDAEAQFELQQDEKTPEKLKKAKFTEISLAARIEKGRIKALKGEDSLIFTYLPTKVFDFRFPFLVNGNFLTNASREAIIEDRFWNHWLFKTIGIKIFDWLELLSKSQYKYQILHLLPDRFDSVQNELKVAFNRALDEAGKVKAFIPNKNGILRIASNLIIDKTGLSEENFISKSVLIQFINNVKNKKFDNESVIHPKVELKWKLTSLGATTFDLENLEDFFIDDLFTSTHKPIDNFYLISFFYEKYKKSDSRELKEKLKSIPFIYTKGKKLKSPKTLCFPSINYKNEFGEGVSVIHTKVYSKIEAEPKIKNWLESLGVKEPSDMAYVENEIIGNIKDAINESNFLKVTRHLLSQHKKGLFDEWHYRKLQDLRLFTTKGEFIPANQCYLSESYEPALKLQKINKAGNYISGDYKTHGDLASEWKTFFIKIGVTDNIVPKQLTIGFNNKWRKRFDYGFLKQVYETSKKYSWRSYEGWAVDTVEGYGFSADSLTIFGLPLLEYTTEFNFSKTFFNIVFRLYNPSDILSDNPFYVDGTTGVIRRKILKNMLQSQGCPVDYFKWLIDNTSIFPTQNKECDKASSILLNTKENKQLAGRFLPVLDCDIIPNEEWTTLIPFKQNLQVEDYLTILEKIAEETEKDVEIKKVNKKRIGLIYTQLSEKLSVLSERKKSELAEWSTKNFLLSESGKFEKPKELKWLKIPGFSTTSEALKTIFIPDNFNAESKHLQELLSLFGVQIIDEFTPSFKNPIPQTSLKKKLQKILPYLVALIEKRQFSNFSTEYERISKIVDEAEFINASEIKLSFKNQEELITGPTINAYLRGNQLYFKGEWKNPLTLYFLVPELLKLLNIKHLNNELQLMLQLNENGIKEWLIEQGIDLSRIKQVRAFSKQVLVAPEDEIKKPSSYENETGKIFEASKSEEDFSHYESFEPVLTPNSLDISKISVETKVFTNANIKAETNFSTIESQEVREDIGRWCEEFVYISLLKQNGKFEQVSWVNKDAESGEPYDIKIVENGVEKFIDVKGTPSGVKDIIYLSPNEWTFMFKKGQNYSIYRVYNAGNNDAKIIKIENPSGLLQQGKIFPNPITLQI